MPTTLQTRVVETIARHGMIRAGNRVGLGVSGGADSVALLRIFSDLRARLGITIFVLHFHHQLRGAEADEDERFVEALAAKFGLAFESGRADVAGEAKRNRWNLEDAARRLRYQFFSSTAASRNLDCVAVAHTADDQAETVLSHLLRGSGITGLAGIHPVAGLVVRPLLDLRRAELREYLCTVGQDWREDATNRDTSRTRARIRHELIPFLEREFDLATVTRLARLASHAREDEEFWRALENERLCALITRDASGAISMDAGDLLAPLPSLASGAVNSGSAAPVPAETAPATALTRRLVRRIYAEVRGSRERLTSSHVDTVLDLAVKSQSGSTVHLPGVTVERIFNRLIFGRASAHRKDFRDEASAGREFSYSLERPATGDGISIVVTEIHRRFNLKVVDWPADRSETVSGRGALDFDRVQWPLVLRNWRPGDSYRPLGSRRVRKLKRLLLESRVPRNVRKSWPVLDSGGSVIWASGCPAAEEVAAGGATQAGLLIGEEDL